jgi:DNA-binding NtrC family response regulator
MSSSIRPPETRVLSAEDRPRFRRVHTYLLKVRSPRGDEHTVKVAQPSFRIGSRQGNDLQLDDPTVSRIHFEISLDEQGYRLRDLGSKNGTYVDGYRTADIYLKDGCRISVGETLLIFAPLSDEAELPLSSEDQFGPLLGKSACMRELFATLERVARTEATVLIEGESGTGKELVAQAIHQASSRSKQPFVVFDCAAAPASLLEAELFGHEKGAFTGAASSRAGYLEEAHGGTLFLDEIGELPLELQPKLLRAIESHEVRRLGSTHRIETDVRVLAATNRDLAGEVNRGAFREDLYYRLAVVRLHVPPLRKRPDDIPMLVEHFIREVALSSAPPATDVLERLRATDWQKLQSHPFAGNVRELKNIVLRSLALGELQMSPPCATAESGLAVDLDRPFLAQKSQVVAQFERAYLLGQLDRHHGNISRAAAASGIDRMYFKRLLKHTR